MTKVEMGLNIIGFELYSFIQFSLGFIISVIEFKDDSQKIIWLGKFGIE